MMLVDTQGIEYQLIEDQSAGIFVKCLSAKSIYAYTTWSSSLRISKWCGGCAEFQKVWVDGRCWDFCRREAVTSAKS